MRRLKLAVAHSHSLKCTFCLLSGWRHSKKALLLCAHQARAAWCDFRGVADVVFATNSHNSMNIGRINSSGRPGKKNGQRHGLMMPGREDGIRSDLSTVVSLSRHFFNSAATAGWRCVVSIIWWALITHIKCPTVTAPHNVFYSVANVWRLIEYECGNVKAA